MKKLKQEIKPAGGVCAHIVLFVAKAKKNAKKLVTLRKRRYSESACKLQVLAKRKEKQTPPEPLIPQVVGTCSLSSLEAQKGAIVASSGKDHILLEPRRTVRSGTGRKARKSVSPLPGFVFSWGLLAFLSS